MNYITTTDLRTQSSQLVETLMHGKKVSLMHRSRIVGEIVPVQPKANVFQLKKFRELIKMPSKHVTQAEAERIYRTHLEEKYGKNLP
jgi:antitoxin (DNA-binding transcriptional repressor) of toxin-antitoxin stability system